MNDRHTVDRRGFLGIVIGAFLAACSSDSATPSPTTEPTSPSPSTSTTTTAAPVTTTAPPSIDALEAPAVDLAGASFGLGVASGEPDDRSLVLWTRLIGELPDSFEIVWEVADDAGFTQLLATGLVPVAAETAHSVRVVVDGLAADRSVSYRFRAGSLTSPTGASRTMPAANDLRPISLGVSSCQARTDGAWAAHRDLAAADVDAVLWLGDYIYGDHRTLDEYRSAYADYRSDPLLQTCHAAHPWISFIDDHEVANDFDASIDPARRGAALRAWWEHHPTRLPAPDASGSLTVHRAFDLGGAVRLIGLDGRQYADDQSLYGDEQWEFIEAASRHSRAITLVASPTIMSGLRDLSGEPLIPYSVDARPTERARMADVLSGAPRPVIVSGDLHTSLVADFSADPLDPDAPNVAVEIMAPAISSAFPARFAPLAPFLPVVNPQVRQVDVANGWLDLTLGPAGVAAAFHYVDDVIDPDSTVRTRSIPDL